MKRQVFLLRCFLAITGILFVLTSGMVVLTSELGTLRFTIGLGLHLLAQLLCIGALCLPGWLAACHKAIVARADSETVRSYGEARLAQFHMGTQTMRLFYGLALLVLCLYGLIANGLQLNNLLRLHRRGVITNATITGTSFREGKAQMNVTYAFTTVLGMPVVDTFTAPRALIRQMRTGNSLPITYLPLYPDIHTWQHVDNSLILHRTLSGLLLFTIALIYLGFPVIIMEGRVRSQLRLVRCGVAVTGTIVACKPLVWRGRPCGYWLTSQFALPNGETQFSQAFAEHVPGEPTLPGFPITILYDSEQPSTNLPLAAFHAVRMTTLRKTIRVV